MCGKKKTCTEYGVLISWEELGSRKNQLGRIGLEIRSVGKNWVGGKISGEELGSRKHQWGRIGSRKDQSRTIGFEKKSVGNNWGSCFCFKHRARACAWQSLR